MVIGNMKERRKANRKKLCYVLILKIVFSEIICIRLFSLIKRLKVLFTWRRGKSDTEREAK